MDTQAILMYGHLWVHRHLEGLTDSQWETPGVCGIWSVKDVLAHLASFEWLLAEVFQTFVDSGPTPVFDEYLKKQGDEFNGEQVALRQQKTPVEVLAEYDQAHERVRSLVRLLSEAQLRQPGTIPWYGNDYSLEDLIVYQYYGHKREHCAQIAVYRDQLKQA